MITDKKIEQLKARKIAPVIHEEFLAVIERLEYERDRANKFVDRANIDFTKEEETLLGFADAIRTRGFHFNARSKDGKAQTPEETIAQTIETMVVMIRKERARAAEGESKALESRLNAHRSGALKAIEMVHLAGIDVSDGLLTGIEKLVRERDAYRKAKAENDDRFMGERDEARAEVEKLKAQLDDLTMGLKA